MSRSGKGRNGGHADMIPEQKRGGADTAAPAVGDDVVGARLQRKIDVLLDMVGAQLDADKDLNAMISRSCRSGLGH